MQNNNLNISLNADPDSVREANETIGEIIKRTRLQKGIEIEKASANTKLKIQYLHAIENNDFDTMPAPIYAKNFIRIYANYLGLDGVEISKKYDLKNIDVIGLPPKKKIALTYYISSFFHFLFRHPFVLLGLVVVVIILFFYPSFSDDNQHDSEISNPPPVTQSLSLDNYQPVFDLNDPLPKS
ncbi:MAG: hypothetical protein DRI44_01515 [Chlamydiae bacterium]|nr:MAG: hypothetical protein DRI44_01515 [Chlamydiota bacterium]